MSFVINVKRLALYGHHGVGQDEKNVGQRFYIDVTYTVDADAAALDDDIERSVSYADVLGRVTEVFTASRFNMIETAASRIVDDILQHFGLISFVSVTVHKPSAPVAAIIDDVSATVERHRNV